MNDENTLLQAARRMDKEALTEIFDLYARPLYRYALRQCADAVLADQIVGDVFAKLLDQLAAGNGPSSNLRAYLYEITHHLVVDQVRYSSRRTPIELVDQYWRTQTSIAPDLENRMEVEKILDAMHSLSADQRNILILRILEDLSINETASILGKTPSSVKVTQHRAIQILRSILETRKSSPAQAKAPTLGMVPAPTEWSSAL